MSIRAVIFDFFGVISSEVSPFWFAERFSDAEAKRLKDEYMTPADRGDLSEDEVFETLSELSGESAEKIRADFAKRVVINKGIAALVETLGRKYKTALLSNAMGTWLEDILDKNDLNRLFGIKVISSFEHTVKPGREIFEIALARLGVRCDEAVFIDDNEKNVEGARAAGIFGIVFKDAESLERTLAELGIEI